MVFNNGVWTIKKQQATIPEGPFEVLIDGKSMGTTKLLAFARHIPNTNQFPQVLVLYSSGYLRLKAGADPKPPIPFGQSLVLGPVIWGTSTSRSNTELFFHPQLQTVAIDTSQINQDGTNSLLIRITGSSSKLSHGRTKINRIMNLVWTLTLDEPSDQATMLDVAGTFEFTEDVIPDPVKTAEAESVRLLQISTMFIDSFQHDVDAFRFRSANDLVTVYYDPALANSLLPVTHSSLDPETLMFDSLHTDDVGQPNGNTPSYRIMIHSTTGTMSGPITVRAFFNSSQNLNHDSLGLWAFQQPPEHIEKGTTGSINYTVIASTSPLPTIDFDPDNACRRYYDRGRVLANRKRYDEAIWQYQKACDINPKYVEAYDSLGWALADKKQYDEAIEQFQKAIATGPDRIERYYHSWGLVLATQGYYEAAIEQYQKACDINQAYAEVYESWGWALAKQEKYSKAIEQFQKAIATEPDKVERYYHSWGLVLATQGQYEAAIEQYQNACNINPKYSEVYRSWGLALTDLNRYDEAINKNPEHAADYYYRWGWVLTTQKRYKEAINKFEKAIHISPSHEKYDCLGFALANQGRYVEAISKFDKAIELNQNDSHAYNNLGWSLVNQGRCNEAIPLFEKATKIDPKYANAYNNWGWALAHDRRYDEAIEKFQKAIDIDRANNRYNVYVYHNYTTALLEQGKYRQGYEKWKETYYAYEQMN